MMLATTPSQSTQEAPGASTTRNPSTYPAATSTPAKICGYQSVDITPLPAPFVSAHDGHTISRAQVRLFANDGNDFVGSADTSAENSEFTFHFVPDGDYQLSTAMALDIDPSALSPSGELDPAAYDSPAMHLYGTATMPLHVAGDMSGITLSLPEATPKELQAFRDAIHRQAQQNPTTAKN
jgi:hypothetical protein